MGYKTILVHADLSRHATARIELAAAICAEQGSHLIGAAMMGVSPSVFPKGYNVGPGTVLAPYFEPLEQGARRALDNFAAIAARYGVTHESRLVCDDVPDGLALLARFADLVVVSQDDPGESLGYTPPAARMPDYVVYNAARPVLVVPNVLNMPHGSPPGAPRRVLLCWNGSREASVAMAASVPLLRRATHVSLAVFAPAVAPDCASEHELADAQAFLARHAVHAQVVLRDPGPDTGRAILQLAAEGGCDLVVMGCYGH